MGARIHSGGKKGGRVDYEKERGRGRETLFLLCFLFLLENSLNYPIRKVTFNTVISRRCSVEWLLSSLFFPGEVGICSLPSLLMFRVTTRQTVDDEATSKDRIDGAKERIKKE